MKQPTIIIKRLALMGYTPADQMYFIMNGGGGSKTCNFLTQWKDKGAFDLVQHMGQPYLGLRGERAAKFEAFAKAEGFQMERGTI